MKKYATILALMLFVSPVLSKTPPVTSFFQCQLEALKTFKPVDCNENLAPYIKSGKHLEQREINTSIVDKPLVVDRLVTIESFVDAVIKVNPGVEKQRLLVLAAKYNLSQTQALEPLLNQFSSFLSQTPTLAPLFKEHPFPGVSALKNRLAEDISLEAEANFNYFLAGIARQARILTFQIIQTRRKTALTSKTIELYKSLKSTSESLYKNGKVSFAELTMISVEEGRLETQKNQYLIMLAEQQETAYAMLGGRRPMMGFSACQFGNFAGDVPGNADNFKNHPRLTSENIRLNRLESSIALVQRMAFPEYTRTSLLPAKKAMSASLSPSSGNARINVDIDFSRVFVKQLQARRQAQVAEITATKVALLAAYESHVEAFKLFKNNQQIIKKQMLPALEKAFSSVRSRYESGQSSFIELVETEKRLLGLKEKLIDSEFETLKAKANILYDLGKIQL